MTRHETVRITTAATPWAAGAGVLILLACVLLPRLGSEGAVAVMTEFFCYLALAQLWNLLAGYAGVISLGQQAFLGLGGYTLYATVLLGDVSPLWGLPGAALVCALLALPIAWVLFRLRGPQLAIGSWVIAEVCRLGIGQWLAMGGGAGISLPADAVQTLDIEPLGRDALLYLLALFACIVVYGGSYAFLLSRNGLALTAIRDNEAAARSCGVSSARTKWLVFVAVAIGTGLVGALVYLAKFRISPSAAFDSTWTSYAIFIVVIGGVGTLEGPLVGTLVFFLLREYLADLGSWYMILLGTLAVGVMLKMPKGLWGLAVQRWGWQLFPTRRRLVLDAAETVARQGAGLPAPRVNGLH
jgi:branched-chain amino acid transport system permease protein